LTADTGSSEGLLPEILLKQTGKGSYQVETPSGIVKFGNGSPYPMTTAAAALAGCLAITVSDTLKVMRQKLDNIEIRMSYERENEEPKIFKHFKVHLVLHGENLSHEKVEKAVHLSEEKTCPMSVMMRLVGAKIETTFSIEELTQTISSSVTV
jgi:putative redox protein